MTDRMDSGKGFQLTSGN